MLVAIPLAEPLRSPSLSVTSGGGGSPLSSLCFGPGSATAADTWLVPAPGVGIGGAFPLLDAEMYGLNTVRTTGMMDDNLDALDICSGTAGVDSDGDGIDDACDWEDINDDNDGCADVEETGGPAPRPGATGPYNPLAWYDFYDVPIPANNDPTPNGVRNGAVNVQDVVGVLRYVGTSAGGPSNGSVDYDSDKDGDTIRDGKSYDRSPSPAPNPPYDAGPPSGAVNLQDVVTVLRQVGLSCIGPP